MVNNGFAILSHQQLDDTRQIIVDDFQLNVSRGTALVEQTQHERQTGGVQRRSRSFKAGIKRGRKPGSEGVRMKHDLAFLRERTTQQATNPLLEAQHEIQSRAELVSSGSEQQQCWCGFATSAS